MGVIPPSPEFSFKSKWRHFTVKDAADAVVAKTVVIEDVEGRKSRLARRLSSTGDIGRLVLQLSDPAGAPILYLERAGRQNPYVHNSPEGVISGPGGVPLFIPKGQTITVVAPDASVIGDVEEDDYLFRPGRAGDRPKAMRHKIVSEGRDLCSIVWEPVPWHYGQVHYSPKYCDYYAPDGEHLAHYKKGSLRLDRPLPEPLHTLMVISPIAFRIAGPAPVG